MTILDRPDSRPSPPAAGDPERSRSIVAVVLAALAGFALAQLAVAAGLLLLAAAVTITLAPRSPGSTKEKGAD